MRGPSAIQSGLQQSVELACYFTFHVKEYKQLDLKWYCAGQEKPFLQWVPSSRRKPPDNRLNVQKKTDSSAGLVKHFKWFQN